MRGFDLLWDEFSFDPIDLESPSDDLVYAHVRARGRGKASEEAVEFDIHHVWRMEDGLYARMDAYLEGGRGARGRGFVATFSARASCAAPPASAPPRRRRP